MNEYALTTLYDVKAFLGIGQTDTTNDVFLESWISACSTAAQSFLNRKIRGRTFTEYHDGGWPYIFVNNPPIRSITSIYDDTARDFAAGTLVASTDYHYDGDLADQGRVQLYNVGAFSTGVRNVKIVYAGGFDEFIVTSGENDRIDWYDASAGTLIQTSLTAATYTGATLATHVTTQMTAATSTDVVTCTYNATTGKFTLTSDGDTESYFVLPWSTGTNVARSVGPLLGFNVTADDTGALTYTGDYAALSIPDDIQGAIRLWVARLYKEAFVKGGDGRMGVSARNVGVTSQGTTFDLLQGMPKVVRSALYGYRRIPV